MKIRFVQTEDKHTAGCTNAAITGLKRNIKLLVGVSGIFF